MTNPPADTNVNKPTTEQLDELDAVADAATPGPWGIYQYGGDSLIEIAADLEDTGTGYRARREICRFEDEPLDNDPSHREWTAEEDWAQVQADAAFIAHAPEDIRALVAEVRRLTAELAQEKAEAARWTGVHNMVEWAIGKGVNLVDVAALEDALGPKPKPAT